MENRIEILKVKNGDVLVLHYAIFNPTNAESVAEQQKAMNGLLGGIKEHYKKFSKDILVVGIPKIYN